jgi:Tol biopolymer transport system component
VIITEDLKVEAWSESHEPPFWFQATVSDDARKLAVVVYNFETGNHEIWLSPFDRPRLRRFIAQEGGVDCALPRWSPDGDTLAYACVNRPEVDGIYTLRVDGSDQPERLLKGRGWPQSFSPDGSQLVVNRENEVLLLPLNPDAGGERTLRTLVEGESSWRPFSPDGHWIAYTSRKSDRPEVYIRRFREDGSTGPEIQISSGGGSEANWSRADMELTYVTPAQDLMRVAIQTGPQLVVSEPILLTHLPELHLVSSEPLPDGGWIAVQQGPEEYEARQINVVQNWFVELAHKLASSR